MQTSVSPVITDKFWLSSKTCLTFVSFELLTEFCTISGGLVGLFMLFMDYVHLLSPPAVPYLRAFQLRVINCLTRCDAPKGSTVSAKPDKIKALID